MSFDDQNREIQINIVDGADVVAENLAHKIVPKIVEGFDRLPLVHKRIMFREGLNLIFARKRLATQYNFPTDVGFDDFKEVLHDLGVEVSKPFKVGKVVKGVWIYDQDHLDEFIKNNKDLPDWDREDDLEKYLNRVKKSGYDMDRLSGHLLGYPDTAVEFFVESKKLGESENRRLRDEGKTTIIMTQDEAYICPVPVPGDVKQRELFKNIFFETITNDAQIQSILNTGKLQESEDEALKYMPWLNKTNSGD